MKKIPGKIRWFGLWLFFGLFMVQLSALKLAEGFAYDLNLSNTSPYVKEAVMLTFEIKQTKEKGVMFFEFSPHKSDAYELLFLGEESIKGGDDKTHLKYRYALFPLQSGLIDVGFKLITKEANTQEVKEVAIGARNVLRVLKTKDTPISLPHVTLDVKALPKGVELVGEYTLNMHLNKTTGAPYEQVDLIYTLKGRGYPPQKEDLLPPLQGVERFLSLERFDEKLFHKWRYEYALLAKESFTIPPLTIQAFDPKRQKRYTLQTPKKVITLKSVAKEELLDVQNSLPTYAFSWEKVRRYLVWGLLFFAGFVTAKILSLVQKRYVGLKERSKLFEKIEASKTPKALLQLLLAESNMRFDKEIVLLERMLYQKGEGDFQKIKKAILEQLGSDDA